MSQEIFNVTRELFKLIRLHRCSNPDCCVNKVLDNLDFEKNSESDTLTKAKETTISINDSYAR